MGWNGMEWDEHSCHFQIDTLECLKIEFEVDALANFDFTSTSDLDVDVDVHLCPMDLDFCQGLQYIRYGLSASCNCTNICNITKKGGGGGWGRGKEESQEIKCVFMRHFSSVQ